MTLGLSIRRNVVTTVAAFSINIMLTFVGFRLVIQQGGTAALGLWSVMTAAIYIIRLGDVGMGSATERHVAATDSKTAPARARAFLDTALLLNGVLFLVLAGIGWALMSYRVDWFVPANPASQAEALRILPLMLTGFVVLNLANIITSGLRGLHLGYQAAYISVAGALLQMTVIILLVPRLGIEGLAWGQLVQNAFIGAIAWCMFNRHIGRSSGTRVPFLPVTGSRSLLRELFGFSFRAQAVNLVNGMLEPASKLIVGHASGMSVLGVYELAYKIVALPRNAVVSGVLGMTPALTRLLISAPSDAEKLYRRARWLVAISTGAVLSMVTLGAPIASILLIGHVDFVLVGFTAILATGFWLNAVGAPAYAVGFAAGRMGGNFAAASIALTTVVTFGWSLRGLWPFYGPVVATTCGLAAGGLIVLWRNQTLLRKSQ